MKNTLFRLMQVVSLLSLVLAVANIFFPVEAHGIMTALHLASSDGTAIAGCAAVGNIVSEDCGSNPGGINNLWVIRRRDVETFPAAVGVTISTAIVPKTGKYFAKWDFAQDTGELNHKSSGDPGNKSVTHEVNTYVPRGNATVDAVIDNAINGDFIVIVEDGLGVKRVGGNLLRGMIFDHDYKSGKKGTDKNGTDFKFAAEGMGHLPFYYEATIPVAPAI